MYKEVFDDVVAIMREDYAGCLDKKGWDNPKLYGKKITELHQEHKLTPRKFAEIVQDYLLDFQDKHMSFKVKTTEKAKPLSNGFNVRRFEDKLYVTKTTKENRLHLGDAIISLNGTPITLLVEKHKRQLMETEADREEWKDIIRLYSHCEVMDKQGNTRTHELKKYEKEKYVPVYTLKPVNKDTLLLTITDFSNPDAVATLIKENAQKLSETINLIIDIRVNYGGSDGAFFEIVPYLFAEQPNTDQFSKDYAMEFNYTERNYQLVVSKIKQQLSQVDDVQFQQLLHGLIAQWEQNRGKGFVSFESAITQFPTGKKHPKNIIVLTDVMCGSSGDIFAYVCKMSPKVTMIGRPTAGLNDYSNLTTMEWEDYEFTYATSRLKKISERDENYTHGIKPHIYIPWTPEHIEKDMDMEKALELLEDNIHS